MVLTLMKQYYPDAREGCCSFYCTNIMVMECFHQLNYTVKMGVNNKTYYFEITSFVLIAKVWQEKTIIFETGFRTVYLASPVIFLSIMYFLS